MYCGNTTQKCQVEWIDPCSGNPIACVDPIDCAEGGTCDPRSGGDNIELILEFDGCGLAASNCGKSTEFVVVGEGTITTNGRVGVDCGDYSSTMYLTLNGQENSLAVEDCDTVNVVFNWFGNACCGCCLDNIYTEESLYCGGEILGYCDPCLSYRARAAKRSLKRSVLSRMKKVHYRP